MFETPILLLIFNRPENTRRVFERIRDIKPKFLFVAGDGPRQAHPDDAGKCAAAREVIQRGVDWECSVKILFQEINLGCCKGVSAGVNWFFQHVEEGIIIEDDCLANDGFFRFSELLLDCYRSNDSIMHIGGGNYVPERHRKVSESYYFSKYAYCWGWATWKRAWVKYDDPMDGLDDFIASEMKTLFVQKAEYDYWARTLSDVRSGKIDTWDFKWNYAIWKNHGLCLHPARNYIKNIGFDGDGTHTSTENETYKLIPLERYNDKIIHPPQIRINEGMDSYVFQKYVNIHRGTILSRIKSAAKKILR